MNPKPLAMKKLLSFLKSFPTGTQSKEVETSLPLRQLVNQVMIGLLPRNLQQKNLIINDVEKGMLVNNERNILANAISRLLRTTIVYSSDNAIHVSANLSGNTTLLNITTNDTRNDKAISNRLRPIKLMTEKIGGTLTVINNKISGTTLSFTFRNQQAA